MASPVIDSAWLSPPSEPLGRSFYVCLEEANPADILPVLEAPMSSVSDNSNIPKPPPLPCKMCRRAKYSRMPAGYSSVPKETKDTWDMLFKEGYDADVCIITEDGSCVPAHSNVLVSRAMELI